MLFNLCLWFHDSVYDPESSQNEIQSNELFLEFAQTVNLSNEDKDLVSWVILDTISHKRVNGPATNAEYLDLSAYFLDADLSILCAD